MENEGAEIHWLEGELPFDEKVEQAIRLVNALKNA
jgi:hypothetical protein